MGRYKELLLNTGLFAFAQVSTKLISFFLVPLYTVYLSTEDFGVTDMSLTVSTMLLSLVTLSISDAVLRFAIDDAKNKDRYASMGFFIVIASCLVVAILSPLLRLPFFGGLDRYTPLFIAMYALNTFQNYFNLLARALNKLKIIPVAAILTTAVTALSAFTLLAKFGMKVEGYFFSLLLGSACGSLVLVFGGGIFRHLHIAWKEEDVLLLKNMLVYSVPLIPNALFWWMSTSINRFLITGLIGVGASGLFAAAQKIPGLLNTASSIFQQAWQLSSFQQFKKGDIGHFFSVVFCVYHAGIACVATGIIALSCWLASFILQKDFFGAWPLIPILILAFYFNILNTFYGTVFTAALKTKPLFSTTVFGAAGCVAFTILLIPLFNIYGAAIAMVLSNALVLALRVRAANNVLPFSVNWPAVLMTAALLCVQAIVMASFYPGGFPIVALLSFACFSIQAKCAAPYLKRIFQRGGLRGEKGR